VFITTVLPLLRLYVSLLLRPIRFIHSCLARSYLSYIRGAVPRFRFDCQLVSLRRTDKWRLRGSKSKWRAWTIVTYPSSKDTLTVITAGLAAPRWCLPLTACYVINHKFPWSCANLYSSARLIVAPWTAVHRVAARLWCRTFRWVFNWLWCLYRNSSEIFPAILSWRRAPHRKTLPFLFILAQADPERVYVVMAISRQGRNDLNNIVWQLRL
jgi:hypothetical protein